MAQNPSDPATETDDNEGETQSGRQSLNVASRTESESGEGQPESTTGDSETGNREGAEGSPADPDDNESDADMPGSEGTADDGETAVAGSDPQNSDGETDPDSDEERTLAQSDSDQNADNEENQSNTDAPQSGQTAQAQSSDPADSNTDSPAGEPQPPSPFALDPQQAQGGQNAETNRRTLKITERLAALAAAESDSTVQNLEIRDRVVVIDRMLAEVEVGLSLVIQREIPDADRTEQFGIMDERLGRVETYIAELREETKDEQFAFVGLQMVDIGRTHVTPARDRVFVAIRDASGADSQATDALQHVIRARELLAALLERYDEVVRERELGDDLDDTITMYEVYVEKMQQLMREARQNRNPLERKMGIIEVDQDYLDRYAEVLTLRREMMAEFARMLADDPRLLAKYMDLIKRRRSSLRDQLTELAERQYDSSTEVSGWLRASDDQRSDLWMLVAELRLQAATMLARDAAELAERLDKQMPLVLDPEVGTAAR